MDIEHTSIKFNDEVRKSVVIWGRVTSIRVVDIKVAQETYIFIFNFQFTKFQFDIDFANSAFYLIFTVLDYPPNVDIQLNDLPDAIRPIAEVCFVGLKYMFFNEHFQVKKNLQNAVNKGWFKVKVYKNDGHGGVIASVAEVGKIKTFKATNLKLSHLLGWVIDRAWDQGGWPVHT